MDLVHFEANGIKQIQNIGISPKWAPGWDRNKNGITIKMTMTIAKNGTAQKGIIETALIHNYVYLRDGKILISNFGGR